MDVIKNFKINRKNLLKVQFSGTGKTIDFSKPYFLILQHPVTTSFGNSFYQINQILNAVKKFKNFQKFLLWPNIDAGNDDISKGIRIFREKNINDNFSYSRNFSPEDYVLILKYASCAIGNSSSFIREGSFMGTPSVIVGDRQIGREHGNNILFSTYDHKDIIKKINMQISNKLKNKKSNIFGNGNASKYICKKIEKLNFNNKSKKFFDI